MKHRVAVEFGMGTSLRREDYTGAAARALRNAVWHNSLTLAQAFGFSRDAMIIDVEIAVQKPDQVDTSAIAEILPYGTVTVTAAAGGLDVLKPDGVTNTVIANAAVVISFDMEPV